MRKRPAPKMAEGWVDLDGEGFELDSVLPSQYHEKSEEWNGEQRLMAAVLTDAVRCYRLGKREAVRWIRSRKIGFTYDFETICMHLKLDAGYIRERLERETA